MQSKMPRDAKILRLAAFIIHRSANRTHLTDAHDARFIIRKLYSKSYPVQDLHIHRCSERIQP